MNDNVHPAFKQALAAISPQEFDEWDDDLMSDICGARLSKPVQSLLITLSQINMTRDSFGVNAELSLKALYPLLVKLRQACIEEWRDQ